MSIVNIHLTADCVADYTTLSVHSFLASVCKNRPQQLTAHGMKQLIIIHFTLARLFRILRYIFLWMKNNRKSEY